MSKAVRLSGREAKAAKAMAEICEDHYACFATIASDAGLERHQIRRTVRALARKGLAEYARGLWTEDGAPAGSGYRLTPAGRAALSPQTETQARTGMGDS